MSKLNFNIFALFGVLFLSSVLLGNGMYSSSNQVFALENQTGTENESEVKADIEQENKCKKDTECENENEINNSLNIVNNGTQSQPQPVSSPCEDCFTSNLNQEQIGDFLDEFSNEVQQEITTLAQLCEYIDVNQETQALNIALSGAAEASGLTFEQYEALIQCLQDAGFDVDIFI